MAKRKKQEEVVQEPAQELLEQSEADELREERKEDLALLQEEQAQDQAAERPPAQQAQTVVLLDPYDIQAPQEFNMRRFATPKETIISLAMSMLDDGQQEPVKVEQWPDGSYHLIFGFRRWQAAAMINEEKLSETPYQLQCIVQQGDHVLDDWIVAGVVENTQRVRLGPLDEAYAIAKMKESGTNQSTIAKRMGVSAATITQRLKLLELPAMAQKRVNRGETPIDLALMALDLPKGDERNEALKALNEKTVTVGRGKRPANEAVEEPEVVEGDSGKVVKLVRPKTSKKMLVELEEYATPEDDGERTKAQVWLLTKLIPWVKNPNRKFQKVMEALENLHADE